jgi:class 3 adenylate cyclase
MLDRYETSLSRQLQRFGGRRINVGGESALAVFDGPARAVTCACAIRDAAAQLGLELRAGLHTGEVELIGDDIAGVSVDVAAGVQAAAPPNHVFVSRTVVDLVAGSGLGFTDCGLHTLDGVAGNWRLFSADA